jgi:hypothetical protein
MIKSGAVIQNRYLNNPYPTNYNPMGRPGNFDVARPHDSSSVFDTGMPKDVSPYQPRVAVSVEIQPKSVFKPRRLQRQLKQVNGAKWGQTALKNIFGGEENVITNYMAQRLLGIVDGSYMSVDTRPSRRMPVDNPLMEFRDPSVIASSDSPTVRPGSVASDTSMGPRPPRATEAENLFNLSLGEAPLRITIPEPSVTSTEFNTAQGTPSTQFESVAGSPSTQFESAAGSPAAEMEAVGEVETQPIAAAASGGLLDIVQPTMGGTATIIPRDRGSEMEMQRQQAAEAAERRRQIQSRNVARGLDTVFFDD